MNKFLLFLASLGVISVSSAVAADDLGWHKTKIQAIHTRANGNVAFKTTTPALNAPCTHQSAWELHQGTNFSENLSLILAAYTSQSDVRIRYVGASCESWGHTIVNEIMIGDFWE